MWPLIALVSLGGVFVAMKRRGPAAPAGYERIASAELDTTANALISSLETSGQEAIALGSYMGRWEYVTDSTGHSKRTIVLYRKIAT